MHLQIKFKLNYKNMTTLYSKILKTDRARESTVLGRTILTESESDRGRVLFCAAFRRLQQKAQVFSMEPNAAVRSRLTHSLEVSQIGRYIADQICTKLLDKDMASAQECMSIVTFVETACLMHDIGNPPFGHFGEAAIRKWFDDHGINKIETAFEKTYPESEKQNKDYYKRFLADFLEFDGNPQGLRVVSKLQWNTDQYGLNLTRTTIASYLKYIRMTGEKAPKDANQKFTTKAGYFITEKKLIEEVWKQFEYPVAQRFPLAYIMEAADDIAYCISDLEDSIEKDIVKQNDALQSIKKDWLSSYTPTTTDDKKILDALDFAIAEKDSAGKEYTYTDFRTAVNRTIVEFAANQYINNHSLIINGTIDSLVPTSSGPGSILNSLKKYCQKKVYCHESVQLTELAGYTAIFGLLNLFGLLLDCSANRFKCALDYSLNKDESGSAIVIEKKYLKLFPEKYIKVYKFRENEIKDEEDYFALEWNARAHLIVDFISGMTDDFSIKTYRSLSGMII